MVTYTHPPRPIVISFYTSGFPHSHGFYCATREYPRGTKLTVRVNGKTCILTVDDWCPHRDRIDLPSRCASTLRGYDRGHILGIRKATILKVRCPLKAKKKGHK